jgi:hypothetical protein
MITSKIFGELIELARVDAIQKVKLYDKTNQGIALYERVSKVVPMPTLFRGDPLPTYLRMIYTGARGLLVRIDGL